MKFRPAGVILFLLLFGASVYAGEAPGKDVHPDESAEHTYNQRFSLPNALENLSQMSSALESFQKLTELSEKKMGKDTVAKVGNTGWEIQNMGFHNWATAVEGTLRKQAFQIEKLRFEAAESLHKAGKMDKSAFEKQKKVFQEAEKAFQDFWDAVSISD